MAAPPSSAPADPPSADPPASLCSNRAAAPASRSFRSADGPPSRRRPPKGRRDGRTPRLLSRRHPFGHRRAQCEQRRASQGPSGVRGRNDLRLRGEPLCRYVTLTGLLDAQARITCCFTCCLPRSAPGLGDAEPAARSAVAMRLASCGLASFSLHCPLRARRPAARGQSSRQGACRPVCLPALTCQSSFSFAAVRVTPSA